MDVSNISNSNVFKLDVNAGKNKVQGKVDANTQNLNNNSAIKSNAAFAEFQQNIKLEAKNQFGTQTGIANRINDSGFNLSQFTFDGKPITELTSKKAKELVSSDGFFGARKTGLRIADSAISLAGNDVEKLKVARDATVKGFKEAENMLGGKLFDISYDTLDVTLKKIDDRIRQLDESVVDVTG